LRNIVTISQHDTFIKKTILDSEIYKRENTIWLIVSPTFNVKQKHSDYNPVCFYVQLKIEQVNIKLQIDKQINGNHLFRFLNLKDFPTCVVHPQSFTTYYSLVYELHNKSACAQKGEADFMTPSS